MKCEKETNTIERESIQHSQRKASAVAVVRVEYVIGNVYMLLAWKYARARVRFVVSFSCVVLSLRTARTETVPKTRCDDLCALGR